MRGSVQTVSSQEAAALLGVSRQTLYAYVSRGLIAPMERGGEGGSRYAREAVEELAKTRRRGRRPREIARATLDWGVPVLETSVTRIEAGELAYRGRDALALAATATLEETAALLWQMPVGSAFGEQAPMDRRNRSAGRPMRRGFWPASRRSRQPMTPPSGSWLRTASHRGAERWSG